VRLTLVKCRWFGVQILFSRGGWSRWHDHDANSWTLFPGSALEQTCDNWNPRKLWFLNRVPFDRIHRVKFPFVMLIIHGKKRQDHFELSHEDMEIMRFGAAYGGADVYRYVNQSNQELSS